MDFTFYRRMMQQAHVRGIDILQAKDMIVEIGDDGTCISVWDDRNPLEMLGDLSVTRLSDVEFDEGNQGWKVHFRNGITLPGSCKLRVEAIDAEVQYVNEHLSELGDWVKEQRKAHGYNGSIRKNIYERR